MTLKGMTIAVPTSIIEIESKSAWLHDSVCQDAAKRLGIRFGFEGKGPIDSWLNLPRDFPYPLGLHLPISWMRDYTDTSAPGRHQMEADLIDCWRQLPIPVAYLCLHGPRWAERVGCLPDDPNADKSPVGPEEYYEMLHCYRLLLNVLVKAGIPVCAENTCFIDHSTDAEGRRVLPLICILELVSTAFSLKWLKDQTGCSAVFDLEHYLISQQEAELSTESLDVFRREFANISETEFALWMRHQTWIRKGFRPWLPFLWPFQAVQICQPKVVHVSGLPQDESQRLYLTADGQTIEAHREIRPDDRRLKRHLEGILIAGEPSIQWLVPETDGDQRTSLNNLCQILLRLYT